MHNRKPVKTPKTRLSSPIKPLDSGRGTAARRAGETILSTWGWRITDGGRRTE